MKRNKKITSILSISSSLALIPLFAFSMISCKTENKPENNENQQPPNQNENNGNNNQNDTNNGGNNSNNNDNNSSNGHDNNVPDIPENKPPLTNPLDQINAPGKITNTNLYADKYAKIINLLSLTDNDILNRNLNKKVDDFKFNDLKEYQEISLTLSSADLSNGSAIIVIKGKYQGVDIPTNTLIEVNGFTQNYQFKHSYNNFEAKIDWNRFFNDKQTNENVNQWSSIELQKYLVSIDVLTTDYQSVNLCSLMNDNTITPSQTLTSLTITDNVLKTLNLEYNIYSYTNSKGWYIANTNAIKLYDGITNIKYDHLQALNYVLENQVNILSNLEAAYFSWYYGTLTAQPDTSLFNLLFEVNQSYYNLYTPNASLLINGNGSSSLIANNNNLIISVKLSDANDTSIFATKTFTINNALIPTQQYIEENKNQPTLIEFINSNDKNTILKKIKSEIKNLNNVHENQKLEINTKYLSIFGSSSIKNIYNSQNEDNTKIANKDKYNYLLFNQSLSSNINLLTNIFCRTVGLDQITICNDNAQKSYLTKVNNNYYYYQPIIFNILFLGDSQEFSIEGYLTFNFLESDFNNIV